MDREIVRILVLLTFSLTLFLRFYYDLGLSKPKSVFFHYLSRSMRPFSVPIRRFTPQSAAQRISELNLFLYLRISGVSAPKSCCGVTLTLIWLSRRGGTPTLPTPTLPPTGSPLPAENPKLRKLFCFSWSWERLSPGEPWGWGSCLAAGLVTPDVRDEQNVHW